MSEASGGRRKETFVASGVASLLLLILSWPAFKYFFFGETFTYIRIYNINGRNLWQAAFSRMDGMFFRPGFFLADIWWHDVLPPDPMFYHVRNAVFCIINLFLFYRVLLKFVESRSARLTALGLFAASKIHLTVIGYINVYEASILLMTILLTVLFWFRYLESRRSADYLLALLFTTFSVYSKDNGFLLIVLLAAMIVAHTVKPGDWLGQARYWGIRLAPFVVISASYLILRYVLTGPLNTDNPIYSPRFSLPVAGWQTTAFLATVGNLSLTNPGFMGERGLSGVLAGNAEWVEITLCAALWLFILLTLWRGRAAWRRFIVPVVWIGLYLSPIFLIRNHQVYYHQEPLVGLALLIGIALDQARRRWLQTAWFVVIALVAVNGFISNRRSYYYWEGTADRAEIVKPIVEAYKGNPPKAIVFASPPEYHDFWSYTIGGALVPHLLKSPDTRVDIVNYGDKTDPDAPVYFLPEKF